MSNAIFEIFSEELPATLQKKIAIDYKQFTEKELKELKVVAKNENIFVGITLNRLVLKLENVEITEAQLLDFIDKTLKDFSKTFPRTMCYPQLELRWLRPIRGLFACIDNQVLSGKYYGLELKNGTYLNKFDFVKCGGFDNYVKTLTKEQIEVDYNKRLEFVKSEVDKEAQKQNQQYNNIKLIEEIAGMSEYCTEPMISTLDTRFNILPFELIELVLRENQRYVVFCPNDKKEIKFLIFGDKITADKTKRENIVKGHRKVVNARLDDALYYWQLDKKEQEKCGGLDKYKEHLKEVLSSRTFIDDITWGDYLKKQEEFAEKIIEDKDILDKTKQLIWETKLDLATGVVAEFPELQGVIGGYYFDYRFNPYIFSFTEIENYHSKSQLCRSVPLCLASPKELLCFYLIDRLSYIQTMYQQGKQPTGSGDKYKVKARMDDVAKLIYQENKNKIFFGKTIDNMLLHILSFYLEDNNINVLFKKRYKQMLENNYKDIDNIKQIADICANLIDKNNIINIDSIKYVLCDKNHMCLFKRIHGYTQHISFIDNSDVRKKVQQIFPEKYDEEFEEYMREYNSISNYLDNHKIEGDELAKQALKYIEVKYFEPELPVEFLEIV